MKKKLKFGYVAFNLFIDSIILMNYNIKSFIPILTFPQIFFEKCLESIFICYTDATKSFNYLHLIENNNHSYTYSSQTSMIFKYTNGFLSYFKDFSQGQEIILLKGG